MTESASRLRGKLKVSGGLLIVGLLVELVTLYWGNPTSFILFIGLGGLLVFAGIVTYLFAIATE